MSDEADFSEPSGAGNFLQRYHQIRKSQQQTPSTTTPTKTSSTPTTPISSKPSPPSPPSPNSLRSKPMPIGRGAATKNVWESVFHPLGKSPTAADRYDLGRGQQSGNGHSASEIHAKGTGISLDDRQID